jgi:hypothetical protein
MFCIQGRMNGAEGEIRLVLSLAFDERLFFVQMRPSLGYGEW